MAKIFSEDSKLMAFLAGVCDFLLLGFLWLLFSVPVVTIGASTTAAYYTMVKGIRKKRGYIWKNFWKSFKMNFVPATILWVLSVALDFLFAFNIYYSFNFIAGYVAYALMAVYALILILLVMTQMYLFPVLSRFNMKLKEIMKTCFFLGIKHLPFTVIMIVIFAGELLAIYASVLAYPLGMILIGSVFSFLMSLPMEVILKKYSPAYDEDDHSHDQWYSE